RVGRRETLLVRRAAAPETELAHAVLESGPHGVGEQDEADLAGGEGRVAPGLVAGLGAGEAEAVQGGHRLPVDLQEPQPQPAAVEGQPGELAVEGRRRQERRLAAAPAGAVQVEQGVEVAVEPVATST